MVLLVNLLCYVWVLTSNACLCCFVVKLVIGLLCYSVYYSPLFNLYNMLMGLGVINNILYKIDKIGYSGFSVLGGW